MPPPTKPTKPPKPTTPAEQPAILRRLRERAGRRNALIALPESTDPRILEAAVRSLKDGLARPVLVGGEEEIRGAAADAGFALPDGVALVDPAADSGLVEAAEELRREQLARGRKEPAALEVMVDLLRRPLAYACLLAKRGPDGGRAGGRGVDGAVMGAVATTADTLRAALRVIGVDPRFGCVTSCFLMALTDERTLVYADCGVVPQPDASQLADIAMQAAEACRRLTEEEPRVALLSFSTKGSADHPSLDVVRAAVEELGRRRVDFAFDGELQADAALAEAVARRKAPGSVVAGRANVLVFPDLNSGNIAYKLTERLAGARAIGPLLQGLRRPIHDLSRGCSTDDVLDAMAIAALDAARQV